MSQQLPLLIELGTDELPVKALPGLARAFFDGVVSGLESRGIAFDRGDAKPLYTPRRLAVLLPAVADEQPEQASEVLGPYLNIALDANGNPTKALEGFAAKAGIDWTQLERTTDNKGERFVHRSRRAGARTADLLPDIVREAIAAMPIPKPMRWGDHDYAFARPVHWLVLLFGGDVIGCELMGTKSGRMSRGHRFMHDKPVWINAPMDYVAALRDAHVLVDADERRERIRSEAQQAAKTVNGHARISDDLLEEVNGLVEWPVAVACKFEREFLAVPHEALISTMETNQKFFAVLDGAQQLSEHFIGIANIDSKDASEVRKGYERVIRPRFADAKFFFDEDLKQGLVAMGDGLKTVTYQAKLGSVADKVQRVATLAETIAKQVGADPAQARRTAELSKNDLQSRMVNEFPELQGIAGRHYATAAGEPGEIALAIDEAWQPRFAGDDIALSPLGKVLAIAERLDTLAGGFAAGLKPTGNKDPFALRRNALGLARTIIESGFDLDLVHLLASANAGLASKNVQADAADLYDFILDRLKGYYGDKGVPATHFNAVAGMRPHSLYDFDRRVDAIGEFAQLPEAEALAAANKRIRNILRKAEGEIPTEIDHALLEEPAELELGEALAATEAEVHASRHDYVAALTRLASLRPHVDRFFDQVMVNADDLAIRRNRLALLGRLDRLLGGIVQLEALA
ncbi:MAG: glycine--tRNA ligase subunit beta [Proteobacteria bacterium]|nr:glycine--tRNA ligase subunit beta [Pseudomonadota bacterium]MBS0217035.1 glycine--tRNA ligase subunit beta [Pseudomonadota bacterium]